MSTYQTGHAAEDAAIDYLRKNGYHILERNYHFGHTEIDIIAKDKTYLVFIEVKYRKNAKRQHPLEAVDSKKQKRISITALHYLLHRHYSLDTPCRFDVLAFIGQEPVLCKNAFSFQCTKG